MYALQDRIPKSSPSLLGWSDSPCMTSNFTHGGVSLVDSILRDEEKERAGGRREHGVILTLNMKISP